MLVTSTWTANAWAAGVVAEIDRRLGKGAELVRQDVRARISTHGPTLATVMGRGGTVHSRPWQAPYYQTGALLRSYTTEPHPHALAWLVGSPRNVARFLEFGTVRMLPRPHLRRSLFYRVPDVLAILSAPL